MGDLTCELCGRTAPSPRYMEGHHLTPVSKKGRHGAKIRVCIDCGDHVHSLFTNRELCDSLNSIEALRAHPAIRRWVGWIRKQRRFGVCHRKKKRR